MCDGNRYELNKKTISQCQKISVPTVAVTIVDGNSLMSFLKTSNFQWNISIENIPVEIVNETKANEQGNDPNVTFHAINNDFNVNHDINVALNSCSFILK